MTPKELTELWTSRVRDYQASGERVAIWCERNQVTQNQLWYWQHKLRQAEQQAPAIAKPQWTSLQVDETGAAGGMPLLVRVGGAAIEVRPGFEPALLADIVKTLKSLC